MPSTDHERRDALPIGTVLRDFTIQAVVGYGGFGVVYRAEHNDLDLTVAIKEYLPIELAIREGATVRPRSGAVRKDFEDGLRRFRDEAQVLVGFDSHPSIVSCREFFRVHGTAYVVMAYEDGRSLAEVLASREAEGRPFTELDFLAVMTPLLKGLARVHAAGVLHRDIKPSNILVRKRDEQPVLIDFGAAKQATARFSKSQAPYTEGYAALEQVADAGNLGPWTDMYGVGALMWRMVASGNRPWEPPHPVRVELRSHAALEEAEDPLPSASELGKGRFPPRLLEAIDRCLRLRETERIQGSHELLEVIRAASDQSRSAVPVEASGPFSKEALAARQGIASSTALGAQVPATWWRPRSSWKNSLGMEFVRIPAGSFLMGSPKDEEDRYANERQHEVRISKGFWSGKHEVTQREWKAVMGGNPSCFKKCGSESPVEWVSWWDTRKFIEKLNERESGSGYGYRLPTEAEWEYAARAGTVGPRYGELDLIAWYGANSGGRTHPVGQKQANEWGLHDMLGNVWEWTFDWYGRYPSGSVTDPEGPESGSYLVMRGNSWDDGAGFVRSASRHSQSPDFRYYDTGFRLVRTG